MKLAICIAIFSIGGSVLTQGAYADAGWTEAGAIEELRAIGGHYYAVRLGVKKTPSACGDKQWFFQDYEKSGSDKMYLMLLESLNSGLRVRVYLTGRCNLDGHSEFSSVSILR
ncbi:MAG: hypothetical protein ABL878_04925 [Burkholderiales bacterium]